MHYSILQAAETEEGADIPRALNNVVKMMRQKHSMEVSSWRVVLYGAGRSWGQFGYFGLLGICSGTKCILKTIQSEGATLSQALKQCH